MGNVGSDSSALGGTQRRFKFREAVLSDVGLRRSENQDAYSIAHTAGTSLYLVADGMGGARGGGTASAIAVSVIATKAFTENGTITRPSLKSAIETANTAIYQRSKRHEDLAGMGTTVVALAFVKDVALIAHVGDSRIYHVRVDTVRQLTRDHTLVQELVESGAIPLEEAESHPIAHMLTRSLGPAEAVDVDLQVLGEPLEPGDRFLLCSDGLYNLVTEHEILQHVSAKPPQDAARALIDLALERGGTDNVTVEIIEVLGSNDESCTVEYPANGERKLNQSSGVDFGGLEKLMEEVTEFEKRQVAKTDNSAAGDGGAFGTRRDEEMSSADVAVIDGITESALPVDSETPALPQVEARTDRVRVQLGMFFIVGLAAGILTLSIYQFQKYRGLVLEQAVEEQTNPVSMPPGQRETFARELENWAEDDKTASAPGIEELPAVPEIGEAPAAAENETPPSDLMQDYAELLSIGPPPKVVLVPADAKSNTPVREIIWEHEAKRVEKLLSELARAKNNDDEAEPADEPLPPVSFFSQDEIAAMIAEKQKVRDRISDLDTKLELLMLPDKAAAQFESQAVGESAEAIERLVAEKRDLTKDIQANIALWRGFDKEVTGRRVSELAARVDAENPEFKMKKEAFDLASASYFDAVDRWEKNPSDLSLASEMGALGRELQTVRAEFETSVKLAIADNLNRMVRRAVDAEIELLQLEQVLNRLGKKAGMLKAYIPLNLERKTKAREAYLNERTVLVARFNEFNGKVSAEDELSFTRSEIKRELLNK